MARVPNFGAAASTSLVRKTDGGAWAGGSKRPTRQSILRVFGGTVGRQSTRAGTIFHVKLVVPIIRIQLAGPRRFSRIRSSLPGHAHARMAWIMATARA